MFNPKLCKVIIESSLIDLKKNSKNKSSPVCYSSREQLLAFGAEAINYRLMDTVVKGGLCAFS